MNLNGWLHLFKLKGKQKKIEKYQSYTSSAPNVSTPANERSSRYQAIDINNADLEAFISLPGIGEKLGNGIINSRDKLGGFHTVEQVAETFGLPDSTYQKIQLLLLVQEPGIKKIALNNVSKEELKMHPYSKWKIANAIVEYRNQHGPFKLLEDLKKIILLDHET